MSVLPSYKNQSIDLHNNEATFREILLPSPDNVNDYVTHIYRKYGELDDSNKAELQTGRSEVT